MTVRRIDGDGVSTDSGASERSAVSRLSSCITKIFVVGVPALGVRHERRDALRRIAA